jgi:hypothetical protein
MSKMRKKQMTLAFAGTQGTYPCGRCGRACKVNPVPGSKATMLKRSDRPDLCVNCAVHDQLRNLYPANLMLARSGPKGLALPHIQQLFFGICQMAGTDARFEEIDWPAIIANWDLPFPTPVKPTARNPVTQEELDRERGEGHRLTERELRAKVIGEARYLERQRWGHED